MDGSKVCNWLEVEPVAPTDISQSNRREVVESHLAVSQSESMLASLESGDRTIIKESVVLLDYFWTQFLWIGFPISIFWTHTT